MSTAELNVKEINKALKAGDFDKATELANEITDESIKAGVLEEIEEQKGKAGKPAPTGKKKEEATGKVLVSTAEHIKLEEDFQLACEGSNIEKMEELIEQLNEDDTFKEFAQQKLEEAKTLVYTNKIKAVLDAASAGEFGQALALIREADISAEEKEELTESIKLRAKVSEELAEGNHKNAAKLVEGLAKDDPFKINVLAAIEGIKEAAKPKPSIRPAKQPKEIQPDDVLKKWEALIDILTRYLAQQQLGKKAWRHIHLGVLNVKQRMEQFKRNLPKTK